MRRILDENEWSTDYTDRCGNCHKGLDDNDKYCRFCGTKRGEGKFEPYKNVMQCIYGPMPKKRVHECKACNYAWDTMTMIDNQKFCPECGARVRTYEDGKGKTDLEFLLKLFEEYSENSEQTVLLKQNDKSTNIALPPKEVDYANSTHSIRIVKTNEIIPLLEEMVTIGRKENNIISIQNLHISGYHASIKKIDEEYYLKDENSTNGTCLNGKELSPYVEVKLSNKDRIVLAKTEELVFLKNPDTNT